MNDRKPPPSLPPDLIAALRIGRASGSTATGENVISAAAAADARIYADLLTAALRGGQLLGPAQYAAFEGWRSVVEFRNQRRRELAEEIARALEGES